MPCFSYFFPLNFFASFSVFRPSFWCIILKTLFIFANWILLWLNTMCRMNTNGELAAGTLTLKIWRHRLLWYVDQFSDAHIPQYFHSCTSFSMYTNRGSWLMGSFSSSIFLTSSNDKNFRLVKLVRGWSQSRLSRLEIS